MRRISSNPKTSSLGAPAPPEAEGAKTHSSDKPLAPLAGSARQEPPARSRAAGPLNSIMELRLRGQRKAESVSKLSQSSPMAVGMSRRGSGYSTSEGSHFSRSGSDSSDGAFSLESQVSGGRHSSTPQGDRLRKAAVRAIANMVAQSSHLRLSKIETIISKTFVLDRHIKAIGLISKKFNIAVSIRESGASTLRCLALGAAAKGHDILEKTLKDSSVRSAYGDRAEEIMARVKAAKIDGYVGHWAPDGHGLIGIYVGPEARDESQRPGLAAHLKTTADGKDYYPIDIDDLEGSLKTLKGTADWPSIPFTGDYDLHDLLNLGSTRGPVTQGSGEEEKILTSVNAGVCAVDDESRPPHLKHKNVVQHGPQYNFVAHMAAEERVHLLPGAVAKPSFPLAMCDRGDWSVISNLEELKAFYNERKLNLKASWVNSDDYFENQSDGFVVSRRSSIESQVPLEAIDLGSDDADWNTDSDVEGDNSAQDSERQAKGENSV